MNCVVAIDPVNSVEVLVRKLNTFPMLQVDPVRPVNKH